VRSEAGGRALVEAVLAEVLAAHDGAVRRAVIVAAGTLAALTEEGPQAAAEVSRTLLAASERVVGECWGRGWQPADVVRVCARLQPERGDRPRDCRIATDLIAAQARRYSAATLEARWSGQLEELGAQVWWGDDGSYLAGLVGREAGSATGQAFRPAGSPSPAPDRASRRALEPVLASWSAVVRRLARLPRIAVLGPLPGDGPAVRSAAAAPATRPPGSPSVEARQLHRIRALLAKAESTTFEEEADALTAKAQQLMTRHSITAALLADDGAGPGSPGGPGARRLGVDEPYEAPKSLLLGSVAGANRCRTAWSREFGFVTVIGFEADLDAVELLYTSLLVQATSAMTRAGGRQDEFGNSRTKSFRRSFLVAYASRIGQRLEAAARDAAEAAAAGREAPDEPDSPAVPISERDRARLLPVLAAREQDVEEATKKLFPRLKSTSLRAGDAEGWAHGTAAADQAVLCGQRGSLRSG
jgi:hypothetical protein